MTVIAPEGRMPAVSHGPERELEHAIPRELLRGLEGLRGRLEVLVRLRATHHRLWSLEDVARSARATAEQIANTKREIDRVNASRHSLIDEFDGGLSVNGSLGDELVRHSETLGELCDRIIILELKLDNAARLAVDEGLPHERRIACQRQHARIEGWREHLLRCLAGQIDDIESGRAMVPPRSEFKMYNDPLFNPVTRAEQQDPCRRGSPRRDA